jgi:hypothetical protein
MKKDVSKVAILGDSHSQGLSAKLKDKLLNSFEVIGYTKPNCESWTLLSIVNQDCENLTKEDVLVLVAGMNDAVSENCVKELGHITQFAKRNDQTNIILLTPPLRYDEVTNVNINDIKKFRKMWKYMKLNEHVTILESPQSRDYFTRHGLHYNGYGKDIIYTELALSIRKLFQCTELPHISLGWDEKPPVLVEIITAVTCKESSNTVSNVEVDNMKLNEHKAYRITEELRGFSLQANYTDRAIAAGQRS